MSESAVFISSAARDRVDHDVFISYSRKDGEFARRLLEALKGENRDTWVDWQSIQAAEDFWLAIVTGIEAANSFIFVISPDSIGSQYCSQEIDHAVLHKKRLIPVVCREVVPEMVHPALRPLDWIFFRDGEFEPAFTRLVKAIDTDPLHTRSHTRLLVKAIEWNKRGRDESFLLRKSDLTEAEIWLAASADKEPIPTDLQRDYITTSRRVEDGYNQLLAKGERALRRVKLAAIVVPIAVAIAAGAGIYAFFQDQSAKNAEKRVTVAEQTANRAEKTQREVQARLQQQETRFKDVSADLQQKEADLQQKEQDIRDVWDFRDAEAQRIQGNYDQALNIINRVIQKNPNNPFALYSRGWTYGLMNNHPAAEADFRQVLKLDRKDKDVGAYNNLGTALFKQNKLDEAIDAYTQAIQINSNNASTYADRGLAYFRKQQYDRALVDLDRSNLASEKIG